MRARSSFAGQAEPPALEGRAEFAILLLAEEVAALHAAFRRIAAIVQTGREWKSRESLFCVSSEVISGA